MPIYEFTCLDCKKDCELLVRSSNWQQDANCPTCGSEKLDKKLSVFSSVGSVDDSSVVPSCSGVPSNCGRCSMEN